LLKYAVVLERGPRNWSAYVPDLPGCIATGKTRAETEKLIREAIELHVAFVRREGQVVPEPASETFEVAVPA